VNVVVVKYNAGNIQSVLFALQRLGVSPSLSSHPEEIANADKVIFPGVGEASSTMNELNNSGLAAVIENLKQPFLGICLGLQLMCKHSEEGNKECLNIFNLNVKKFIPNSLLRETETVLSEHPGRQSPQPYLKVPHVGWNTIHNLKGPLFKGIEENSYVYFVHSYYAEIGQYTCAITDYINPFSAAVIKDNFYSVQFHPEKSGTTGERILKNFIEL
jgi:imidazole glycerol-phosphate synthase subunit HisH